MKKETLSIAKKVLAGAFAATLAVSMCFGVVGCKKADPAPEPTPEPTPVVPETRTVTDMVGRTVEIPYEVKSVATFGSVGVLNAFVECMGAGDLIVNEMPANFTKNDKWAMQYKFAPQIKGQPVLETSDGLDMEKILTLNPDLCITMTKDTAEQLEQKGIACIVLSWNDVEDVKTAVTLMGEVFGVPDIAADYIKYFDDTVARAAAIVAAIPADQRVTALYGDVTTLKNPHIISEWWISAAGGISVSAADHTKNTLEFTLEQLLNWAPQVIFCSVTDTSFTGDATLASIPAIADGKVYIVPTVAHVWGNRTVEQPLTVLWALNKMYPEQYSDADLAKDIKYFYSHFFQYEMTDAEVQSIINYGQK